MVLLMPNSMVYRHEEKFCFWFWINFFSHLHKIFIHRKISALKFRNLYSSVWLVKLTCKLKDQVIISFSKVKCYISMWNKGKEKLNNILRNAHQKENFMENNFSYFQLLDKCNIRRVIMRRIKKFVNSP